MNNFINGVACTLLVLTIAVIWIGSFKTPLVDYDSTTASIMSKIISTVYLIVLLAINILSLIRSLKN